MRKIFVLTIVLVASVIIGILGILTAIKLTTEKSIAPTAPEIKPRAEEIPPAACTAEFILNPTPTVTEGPSPTPTVTGQPTPTVTGQPTPTVTVTTTQPPNVVAKCTGLSASPTTGDAPLQVTFVASGYDNNEGYIAGFDFTFGDGETKKIEQTFKTTDSYTITHTYGKVGTYIASVRIKDNNGDWSDIPDVCKQTIILKGAGASVSPQPTIPIGGVVTPTTAVAAPQIPQAGNFLPVIFTILGGAIIFALGWIAI